MTEDDDGGISRRDFLKTTGAAVGTAALSVDPTGLKYGQDPEDSPLLPDSVEEPIEFLHRLDWRNLGMLTNGIDHLTGKSREDWAYNWDHFLETASTFVSSVVGGGNMNSFQKNNAEVGYVSSPEDGIGAGFTDTGRMSTLFFPHTGAYPQIPYYPDGDGHLEGAKPREGGFGGIVTDDELRWLWEEDFEHDVGYREGSAIFDMEYLDLGDAMEIGESAYVLPGEETVVRDFEITNSGEEPIDGSFLYYTQANVTDELQNFILWDSHENLLEGGDGLRFSDLEGPYELEIAMDAESQGHALGAFGLEDEEIDNYPQGLLHTDLELEPGETAEFSVFLNGGEDAAVSQELLELSPEERQARVEEYWDGWTEGLEEPVHGDPEIFDRAAMTLGMVFDPDTASIPAAPNLQPMYYPSWVRDGAITATAMAEMGKPEMAKRYLGEFLPSVQEPDGSFKQCYASDGEFAGIIEIENDQPGVFAWAVEEVYQQTGDEEFLEQAWPAVEDAVDYLAESVVNNGLLAATPDVAEMPTDARQALWTNTFAYRAFGAADRMADAVGADRDFSDQQQAIGDAIDREYFEQFEDADRDFASYFGMTGPQTDPKTYTAAAIEPTGWAEDYDRVEELTEAIWDATLEDGEYDWIPGTSMFAWMLYDQDLTEEAEYLREDIAEEQRVNGGYLKEMVSEQDHLYASPLAWSQAAYINAAMER